ncbi:DUF7563 family protein [Halorussus amylolyticus]|uniref:DUF7563 family protein n=1 Tax=Halorussus amylolyticus TaxID=1126242 RepID=UPI00192F944B|nr:hypothetical protein [Halorussus amylolyticus]
MAVQLPDAIGEPDESRCLFCENPVPKDFRRVFGDDENHAHRCRSCDTFTRIKKGTAAGREVANTDPVEDPQKQHHVSTDAVLASDGGDRQ